MSLYGSKPRACACPACAADLACAILRFPPEVFTHHVILKLGEAEGKRFPAGAERTLVDRIEARGAVHGGPACAFDELHHTGAHAKPELRLPLPLPVSTGSTP